MPADATPLDWSVWRGLPHEIGADPRDGLAACCLVIAVLVLESHGVKAPPVAPLVAAAKRADWDALEDVFLTHCVPISEPVVPSITLLRNSFGLGIGSVIAPNTLLTVDHKRGVITLPINRLRFLQYHVIKH